MIYKEGKNLSGNSLHILNFPYSSSNIEMHSEEVRTPILCNWRFNDFWAR